MFQQGANYTNPTRGILLIDTENRELYVLATASAPSREIYYKLKGLDSIGFTAAEIARVGTPFIQDPSEGANDLTSAKHLLSGSTDLIAVATDSQRYLHNYLDLGVAPPVNAAPTASNVVISGTAQVGQPLNGSYTYADADVPSDPQGTSTFRWLRGTTPIAGATAQSYTLVTADLNAMIRFEVTPVAQSGTSPGVPVTSPAVGPVAPAGGGGGSIVHEQTVTGGSGSSSTVATSAALTGVPGNLYLAAISSRPQRTVTGVSGLGLIWTQVATQCGAQSSTTTRVSVWKAQGTPTGNGPVTATLSSAPTNAIITASRYSGVAAANPIGNVISGNTRGPNANVLCSGGTNSSAYGSVPPFNLTTTVNNAVVYGAVARRDKTHTPGAGYTERSDVQTGSGSHIAGIASQDRTVPTASTVVVNGTLVGTTDWAVIGMEIKPQ